MNSLLYTLYNETSKKTISFPFEKVSILGNNGLLVENHGKFGLYDYTAEKIIIPVKYDKIQILTAYNYLVKRGNMYGIYSLKGEEIIPPVYINIERKNELWLLTKENNKYNIAIFIRNKELSIIANDFENIGDEKLWRKKDTKWLIPCKKDGKFGIVSIDTQNGKDECVLPLNMTIFMNTEYLS